MVIDKTKYKYIYGPVCSWRMGVSLGIDPVTAKGKICNFDCIYCQLGRTAVFHTKREDFVPVEALMEEINSFPAQPIDYYTFSGRGEPTLAKNLGDMIRALRAAKKGKIAVITNAALMDREDVRKDLSLADLVIAKLDACSQESLQAVDVPPEGIRFKDIVAGLKAFKREFKGKLAVQMMFIEGNKDEAPQMAQIAREIGPDEIQINTPLRPGGVKPLSRKELDRIKQCFGGLPAVCVYEVKKKDVQPLDEKETIRRHGNFKMEIKTG